MSLGSNLKTRRYVRNKKDPNSTCLDSAVKILDLKPVQYAEWIQYYCKTMKSGLEDIKAFLRFAQKNDSGASKDLVSSIEEAFESAGLDIKNAIPSNYHSVTVIRDFSISLVKKVGLFKARIHEAYGNSISIQGSFTPGIGPYVRAEKSGVYSTCLDYAIEAITKRYGLNNMPTWREVEGELKFIQLLLVLFSRWSDADECIDEKLRDLIACIEDAFRTVEVDVENAIKNGDVEGLDALHLNLLKKIKILKPTIIEACVSLSQFKLFQNAKPLVLDTEKSNLWDHFLNLLISTKDLIRYGYRSGCRYEEFFEIARAVQHFGNAYIEYTSKWDDTHLWGICSLMNYGAIKLALVLYLSIMEELNGDDLMVVISDLQQRMRLKFSEILDMYMQPLRVLNKEDVKQLVGIILPRQKISLQALRDGLHPLIDELVDSASTKHIEDVKQLRAAIQKVVYDCIISLGDKNRCLEKIEFLREEVVLRMLISMPDSISTGRVLELINMGRRMVQTLVNKGVLMEMSTLILKRMERVVVELKSLQILTGRRFDALKVKLCTEFKIANIQAFLVDRCSPSLIVILEDKVHTLDEGLQLLFKYFSLFPIENQGFEDLIITCFESVVREKPLPYKFLGSNQDPQHIINQMSIFLSNMMQGVNHMNSQIQEVIVSSRSPLMLTLPKTHQGLDFVDSIVEKMKELMIRGVDLIGNSMKHQIESVLKELACFRSFLLMRRVGVKQYQNPDLHGQIIKIVHEADYIIDWILLGQWDWKHMFFLSICISEMNELNCNLANFVRAENDFVEVHVSEKQTIATQASSALEVEEIVISLEDQEEIIIHQLITKGTSKKRNVVTISGMPGIGKTTLAKKVYNHPRVKTYFHKIAWCCISQVYRKRELLLKILRDITKSSNDDVDKKSDDELMDMLYKCLKGVRYCIVLDDVWSNQVWEECGIAFPDDKNGSRIIITTRNLDVAQPHGASHTLRSFTKDESWKLLRRKVFHEDVCPPELEEVGLIIAGGCKGLPLSIVAIAGILKTKVDVDWWKQIEKDLNSHIFDNPEIQCRHILELSYNHLPDNLKPCFLYFAAFGEDSEVPVKKLIWFWIAEGFVREAPDKTASMEDVAEIYVMNLIARSLLMVVKRGSDGKVKACRVHDMLYKVCLRKVEEDNFLHYVNGYDNLFPSNDRQLDYGVEDAEYSPISVAYNQRRLSLCSKRKHFVMLKPSGPFVRTLIFKATSDTFPRCPYNDVEFITENFKILSILDIESINIGSSFLKGIELLYPLRYLGISGDIRYVPSTISKLWNLETLVVKGLMGKVTLPDTLWSMSKLRHLHVTTQAIFSLPDVKDDESTPELRNMVSLSCPALSEGDHFEKVMKRFPKLQKLRCTFSEPAQHSKGSLRFPTLEFFVELESLKIIYYGYLHQYCQLKGVRFPLNLKKLSLSDFSFTWDDFSVIGKLPNLNILKLVKVSFDSPRWEMTDDEFRELEYLKLDSLKITDWNVECDPVPNIKQLVLRSCIRLKEVPASFGDIPTLEVIELKWCSSSTEDSVMAILEQKLEYGDKGFKAFINGFVADPKFSMDD